MQTMMHATMLVQAMDDGDARDSFITAFNWNFELMQKEICCKNVMKLKP
jgi:hypothetical protein